MQTGSTPAVQAGEERKRYASSPATQFAGSVAAPSSVAAAGSSSSSSSSVAASMNNGLVSYGIESIYPANGLGFMQSTLYPYGASGMAGAMPFIPQALQQQTNLQQQQQQHQIDPSQLTYSNTPSPYLGISTPHSQGVAFDSPSSANGRLPLTAQSYAGPSFVGVAGQYEYDSSSPYSSSPNLYSPHALFAQYSPYPNAGAFMGMSGGMGTGIQAASSPGSVSPALGFGSAGAVGFSATGQMVGAMSESSGRTVYVGNLPADASVDELLSQVRFGPIENVKVLPEKSCAFLSFLDSNTAAAFHSDALMRRLKLHDNDLKIGWGKPSPVSPPVLLAVQQFGATRNVYLGNLPETVTEQSLRDELSRFGPIDQVKIVRDKNIGFVHFLSIGTAIKVVQTLPTEQEWIGRRISYGKDRCAYVPKNQHQQQQHNLAAAARGNMAANYGGILGGFVGDLSMTNGDGNLGNRTLYLGNVHPQTTIEEICNTIRGGVLQQIRYIADKHICFATFVDAQCALAFFQSATYQGLALHNRRLKVGWGKHSGPPSPGISMVVQSGGSRNVYLGNIEDFDLYTEEKLRKDFGEFGEIELINTLREKQCAFINFTNIANAIKSIEAMKLHPEYTHLKIAYGKDRCGNPPRNLGFAGYPQRSPYIDGSGAFSNTIENGPGHIASFAQAGDSTSGLGVVGVEMGNGNSENTDEEVAALALSLEDRQTSPLLDKKLTADGS